MLPSVFFGHGSPMNALGGPSAEAWAALGRAMPRPRAVLMVSAHWETDGPAVTADLNPRTIHDFTGFPQPLHEIQYPAPGAPDLARRVAELLAPEPVRLADDWGIDHGTWAVLRHVWPGADVPVVQLSLDRRLDSARHYARARRLAPLRDEGVLIAGSGDIVHNLRLWTRQDDGPAYPWAVDFNEAVKAALLDDSPERLIDWVDLSEQAQLSVPTDEHFLPLLYVAAQHRRGDPVSFFNDRIEGGSISMTGVVVG